MTVVPNAVAPVGQDTAQATEALVDLEVEVCPVRLGHRVAFSRSLIAGQTAQEFEPGGKAAGEIERLHDFVCNRVHLCTTSKHGGGTRSPTPLRAHRRRESPPRSGRKHIGGYFDPAVSKQLHLLAVEEDSSVQRLLDLLFQARGKTAR